PTSPRGAEEYDLRGFHLECFLQDSVSRRRGDLAQTSGGQSFGTDRQQGYVPHSSWYVTLAGAGVTNRKALMHVRLVPLLSTALPHHSIALRHHSIALRYHSIALRYHGA